MENLKSYFPQFPENNQQITFLGHTFTYNKEQDYWSHQFIDLSDNKHYSDNYFRTIYNTTTVYFNKEVFDWNSYNNLTFI